MIVYRMVIIATINCELPQVEDKIEQDESYAGKAGDSEESGIYSHDNNSGSSYSRDSDNWVCFKDEVFDISVFSLPEYIQSSNLKGNRPSVDYSSILESIQGGQG